MGDRTIVVSQLAAAATESDIRDFFNFCGEIESLNLSAAADGSHVAHVTFASSAATETALLLSNAVIAGQTVKVTAAGAETTGETANAEEGGNEKDVRGVSTHPITRAVLLFSY
jgi:hypothetical protein